MNKSLGFTLVETLVGTAIFVVLVLAVYDAYQAVYHVISDSRYKIAAIDLANEQIELARNLPYNSVGIIGGLPAGLLTHSQSITRDAATYTVVTTVRSVDDPFDGTFPTDTSPDDYKLVQVEVDCPLCNNYQPVILTTQIAPKYLETAASNGALIVNVFDANGKPVPQANVTLTNSSGTSTITVNDVTNNSGVLQEVDVPPAANAWHIVVTKPGYSTDGTYTVSGGNPHPAPGDATVLDQQVTNTSFAIDQTSTMNVSSVNETCTPVNNVAFSMQGAKTIGTSPIVYKYSQNLNTGSSGTLALSNMEWDSYNLTLTDPSVELIGTNPLLPLALAPGSSQNVALIVEPKNPDTILVTVKDSSTGLPISNASVTLENSGGTALANLITGQGFFSQTDWSGGSGQATSTVANQYLSSDGNIAVNAPIGGLTLRKSLGVYVSDGNLTSSTFDTGGASNFGNIVWSPYDQPTTTGPTDVQFQLATNNDGGTWNYLGPDGTASTYYTTADTNINAVNNGNRYLRYKLFLHTDDTTTTPNIANIAFTFTTSCAPPGQVSFSSLSSGNYNLQVSATGYQTQTVPVTVSSSWQSATVTLSP
jgi:hypothetical protein